MVLLEENGKKYLYGPMTESGVRNRNLRLYPKPIAKTATLELKERVMIGGVLSYLEHPSHSDLIRENSAGVIVEVEWNDDTGIAFCKVEILEDTISGKEVLKGLKEGKTYGISTRGEGRLDDNKVVLEGLKFLTADIIESHGRQSCQICNLTLTENIEDRTNTMSDFLESVDGSDCGCYLDLNELEQRVVYENLKQKIIEIFKKD